MDAFRPAGPTTESVWDYPRPPRVEADDRHIVVEFAGSHIADTFRAMRVLETSHPPVFYIPREDTRQDVLLQSENRTWCEWKGVATYWDLRLNRRAESSQAAWSYENPSAAFIAITGHLAFYPSRVDRCWVGGEPVIAQPGDFYGGWVTNEIVGPFKGMPGTGGW